VDAGEQSGLSRRRGGKGVIQLSSARRKKGKLRTQGSSASGKGRKARESFIFTSRDKRGKEKGESTSMEDNIYHPVEKSRKRKGGALNLLS